VKLDTVTQIYSVLRYGRFARMVKPDVAVVLLDPSPNGTAGLSNRDFSTLANVPCFEAEVTLDGPKDTGDLPGLEDRKSKV
jgi:hypothetical protein